MINYFAYGSNLHPLRLMERVPSANLIGAAKLSKHVLAFHKKGRDDSGKCNLLKTGSEADLVHGAIYELDQEHKSLLDEFESRGCGYMDERINLFYEGKEYDCFTYYAQQLHIVENIKPYHWYKTLVLLGTRYLQLPHEYVNSIEQVESIEDANEERKLESEVLIEKIMEFG